MVLAFFATVEILARQEAPRARAPGSDPARLARIRTGSMPAITQPVMFDTPQADAILSALEVYPPDNMPIEGWPVSYQRDSRSPWVTLDDVQCDRLNQGGDRHGIVVDPVNRMLFEFYQARKTAGGWQAAQASIFDLKSNQLRPDGWTSADAAGLPIFPAVVRYDELKRGLVEHAMRVTVRKTRRAYVAPATHYASRLEDENLPRMGERIRLRADFDVSGFSAEVQAILNGLKMYGMFVADNGIDWAISVAPDPRIGNLHEELRRVEGSDFEVVQAPSAGSVTENYLSRLQKTVTQTRSNLATLTESADRAAHDFLSGGNLWVAGRQADFISEACGRAGGLMAITPLGRQVPTNHDVVLYAVPGSLDDGDLSLLKQWQERGTTVITFCSSAGLFDEHFPVDTVANVIELWTWTGEFVAACTRLGRMPVLYQSYGLPGGPERGKKYHGKRFHDDLTIKPITAGVLGRQLLDQIERMLAKIDKTPKPNLLQAAQWWRQARSATTLVTGHMFPRHGQDPRALQPCDFIAVPAWEDKDLLDTTHPPSFVLYLGYQFAPQKLVEQAKAMGVKLVYCDVQPTQPPEPASNILFIDPAWLLADGCVTVPGYDIPILPASGAVQAAVYWTIASERAKLTP
jgi:hypothetical protein